MIRAEKSEGLLKSKNHCKYLLTMVFVFWKAFKPKSGIFLLMIDQLMISPGNGIPDIRAHSARNAFCISGSDAAGWAFLIF